MGAWASQRGSEPSVECVCVWVSPGWGSSVGAITGKSIWFFIWFRNWISLLCDGTEPASYTSSLLVVSPGKDLGTGVQVGRAAIRQERWGAGEGHGRHCQRQRLALDPYKIQKAFQCYFHRMRPENTEWPWIILISNSSIAYFQSHNWECSLETHIWVVKTVLSGLDSLS